jgi:hypothetical protein
MSPGLMSTSAAKRRCHRQRPAQRTTKTFLSHFGLDTLRDLPDLKRSREAGLLSKDKLLAGDIPVVSQSVETREELPSNG